MFLVTLTGPCLCTILLLRFQNSFNLMLLLRVNPWLEDWILEEQPTAVISSLYMVEVTQQFHLKEASTAAMSGCQSLLTIHSMSLVSSKAVICQVGSALLLLMITIQADKVTSFVPSTLEDAVAVLCSACMMGIMISFHIICRNWLGGSGILVQFQRMKVISLHLSIDLIFRK